MCSTVSETVARTPKRQAKVQATASASSCILGFHHHPRADHGLDVPVVQLFGASFAERLGADEQDGHAASGSHGRLWQDRRWPHTSDVFRRFWRHNDKLRPCIGLSRPMYRHKRPAHCIRRSTGATSFTIKSKSRPSDCVARGLYNIHFSGAEKLHSRPDLCLIGLKLHFRRDCITVSLVQVECANVVWGWGLMSSEADFIVSPATADAAQWNSIAINQSIQAAVQQCLCN
jgi:hypothetical protein